MDKTKLRKSYNILIRLAIVLLTVYFIYDQVFYRKDLKTILDLLPEIAASRQFQLNILFAILLFPVNQLLEAFKWKYLIKKLESVSLWTATKAVLTGVSVSMFMPNRVGDYLGRVFVLRKANRIQAILVTIIGSMAQLLTTILYGCLALLFFFPWYFDMSNKLNMWLYSGLILMIVTLLFMLIFAYLNFASFSDILRRNSGRFYDKIKKYSEVFVLYEGRNLVMVLLISALRYVVFSFQFYLLLKAFFVPINYYSAIVLIGLVYLMMTIIPTIALTELGVRGSVSLFIFTLYLNSTGLWTDDAGIGIVSATSLLWLINLAVPALLGVIFVYSLRFFRKSNGNSN
jgi:uncharacterized membrane protein YbhN (UPF0104 family)